MWLDTLSQRVWDTIHNHVVVDVHTTVGILYRRMVCRMHICILWMLWLHITT